MKIKWSQLGGQLGIGVCVLGLFFVFLGWNGAASYDRETAQIPYVISGGLMGLGIIIIGAALIVVQNQRADRAQLEATLQELRQAVEKMAGSAGTVAAPAMAAMVEQPGLVVAGSTSYHRPTCRLVEGRGALPAMSVDQAEARGLTACRACDAADVRTEAFAPEPESKPARRPAKRAAKRRAATKRAATARAR